MTRRPSELLIVFAREPEPGRGKTRLAAQSNEQFAHAVYQRLLFRTLRLARRLVRSRRDDTCCRLIIAGDWRGANARHAPVLNRFCEETGSQLLAQRGEDLGARMNHAFADGFAQGASRIVLIGCDCPTLSPADLHAAFGLLQTHDLVVAPVRDGGYCLIGLNAPAPHLFEGMRWSVDTVLSETIARAAPMRVAQLPEQSDIDDLADWQLWCEQRARRGLAEAGTLLKP